MPRIEANLFRGRARLQSLLIHLFLLTLLGYSVTLAQQNTSQISDIWYSNNHTANLQKPFQSDTLSILSNETGLTANGTALCLTQPIPTAMVVNTNASGRGLYKTPVQVRDPATKIVNSFSTMFSFWIQSDSTYKPGQGLAFVFAPDNTSTGSEGMYLGWLNSSTNGKRLGNFAVEFDTVQNEEFDDPQEPHVGVNIDNLRSISNCTSKFGYYKSGAWNKLSMATDTELHIYAWITYSSQKAEVNVTVSPSKAKPDRALLTCSCNLSDHIQSDNMFVGFTASTGVDSNGPKMAQHSVYEWSFGIGNLTAKNLFGNEIIRYEPAGSGFKVALYVPILGGLFFVVVLVSVGCVCYCKYGPNEGKVPAYELKQLDSVRGPQKFSYRQLSQATNSFSTKNKVGEGGFGSVYKGGLPNRCEVLAVKRISKTSRQGVHEFVAEVKVIGRVRHRNLVPLLGWCHDVNRGELLLVYEFMPNGSLDEFLFKSHKDGLTWETRVKILGGVGAALAFLHEECDQRVVHRDVKAGNVMLDVDFNARLGDFGLARVYDHSQDPGTTLHVAGTVGYMAPELSCNGKATEKTDVFSFGILTLEIATGIKASGVLPKGLADWVWSMYGENRLLDAADVRLEGRFDPDKMAVVLQLGLLCSHPDADSRPTMRQSLAVLKGEFPLTPLPPSKPLPMFAFSLGRSESILFTDSTTRQSDFHDLDLTNPNTTSTTRSSEFSSTQDVTSSHG